MTMQPKMHQTSVWISFGIIFQLTLITSAFLQTYQNSQAVRSVSERQSPPFKLSEDHNIRQHNALFSDASSSTPSSTPSSAPSTSTSLPPSPTKIPKGPSRQDPEKNTVYISGLLESLETALDKYICTGALATRTRAYNLVKEIEREALDKELVQRAFRLASRAGMPLDEPPVMEPPAWSEAGKKGNAMLRDEMKKRENSAPEMAKTDPSERRDAAQKREGWEAQRGARSTTGQAGQAGQSVAAGLSNSGVGPQVQRGVRLTTGQSNQPAAAGLSGSSGGRSALSNRATTNGKPDLFMPQVGNTSNNNNPSKIVEISDSKKELENALGGKDNAATSYYTTTATDDSLEAATKRSSELVASAGSGADFEGQTLGIGGLDGVLGEVKRRIWVPLAAPPELLNELGINPVRGLLLYGMPGCGKTLLARTIGKILSPARPITVVSGPEIMDKFVGSSEKNLRALFDEPPDIYDTFRLGEPDGGEGMAQAALHVIVLDEFDAMARTRGGRGGKGDQGDAGVARDSVVNQMLAKMDGVDPLVVPTLVIGLTNKRSLVEPALLRPGRFEVQIEVPPPKTVEQRISIIKVHTGSMFEAGRVLVSDAPSGTAAARRLEKEGSDGFLSYDQILNLLAVECDGMSGAMLAGIARAAASHALERAVCNFAEDDISSMLDCLVTQADFEKAIEDVLNSSGDRDWEGSNDADSDEKSAEVDKTSDEEAVEDDEFEMA